METDLPHASFTLFIEVGELPKTSANEDSAGSGRLIAGTCCVNLAGAIKCAARENEEGAIGSGREAEIETSVADGAGKCEGRADCFGGNVGAGRIAAERKIATKFQPDETAVAACDLIREEMAVAVPLDPHRRTGALRSEIAGLAASPGNDPDVAAGLALIAHEAADKGDGFAVRRPAGQGYLQAMKRA